METTATEPRARKRKPHRRTRVKQRQPYAGSAENNRRRQKNEDRRFQMVGVEKPAPTKTEGDTEVRQKRTLAKH